MNYNKVIQEFISSLIDIIGSENVKTDEATLEKYSTDETPHGLRALPEVVLKPENTEQVSKILSLADQNRIPVTLRGQGTGLSSGAVPALGGMLISFERMNRILEVDEDNLMAVVEAGVVLQDLRREVEKRGLFYPADPGERTSMVGGNVGRPVTGAWADRV